MVDLTDVDAIIAGLEQRGVPDGMWLLEIARARQHVRQLDELLWRLEQAIAAQARTATPAA